MSKELMGLHLELAMASGMIVAATRCSQIIRENNISDSGIADMVDIEFGLHKDHEYLPIPWDVFITTETTKKHVGVIEAKIHFDALMTAAREYQPKTTLKELLKDNASVDLVTVRPKSAEKWIVFLIDTENPMRTKKLGEVWATDNQRALKSANAKFEKEANTPGLAISVAASETKARA